VVLRGASCRNAQLSDCLRILIGTVKDVVQGPPVVTPKKPRGHNLAEELDVCVVCSKFGKRKNETN
jgi:hypothetical protein